MVRCPSKPATQSTAAHRCSTRMQCHRTRSCEAAATCRYLDPPGARPAAPDAVVVLLAVQCAHQKERTVQENGTAGEETRGGHPVGDEEYGDHPQPRYQRQAGQRQVQVAAAVGGVVVERQPYQDDRQGKGGQRACKRKVAQDVGRCKLLWCRRWARAINLNFVINCNL